ncbi:MAG: lactate utilization protein [Alphaproteobacteria bacterium]|nr:lactate utilization protein [Alphaproteobacteria bacterium]
MRFIRKIKTSLGNFFKKFKSSGSDFHPPSFMFRQNNTEKKQGNFWMPPLVPWVFRSDLDLFEEKIEKTTLTLSRVAKFDHIPGALYNFLSSHNFSLSLKLYEDPFLLNLPWNKYPKFDIITGFLDEFDKIFVSTVFAGIVDSGSLMLFSGPDAQISKIHLPNLHVVVVRGDQIVTRLEEAWKQCDKFLHEELKNYDIKVEIICEMNTETNTVQNVDKTKHMHVILVDEQAKTK